jgi:hypothetical protein
LPTVIEAVAVIVPAVVLYLKFNALAAARFSAAIVRPFDPAPTTSTKLVLGLVIVKPVREVILKIVSVIVLVSVNVLFAVVKFNARVEVDVVVYALAVKFLPLKAIVPAVCVTKPVIVKASCNVHVPVVLLKVIPPVNVPPLPVIVLGAVAVSERDVIPVTSIVFVADNAKLPKADNVNAPVKVRFWSIADISKFRHVDAPVRVTVIAALISELALKIALSAAVGTDAPLAPPDEADQLVVLLQLPDPPTQYLSAI